LDKRERENGRFADILQVAKTPRLACGIPALYRVDSTKEQFPEGDILS
jgi:hypothetical protein